MDNLVTQQNLPDGNNNPIRDLACVVLTRNAQPRCRQGVESLMGQSVQPEIVVVNSGAGDPFSLVEPFDGKVKLIHHGGRLLPGAARNLGISATTAPYVAFLTCDCVAQPEWVRRRVEAHQHFAAVSSEIGDDTGQRLSALASYLLMLSRNVPDTDDEPWLRCCLSYSRTLFHRYGFFREDLRAGDDREFHQRFENELNIHHCCGGDISHGQPGSVGVFLKDQYFRGHRTNKALVETDKGALASCLWRIAIRRLPGSFRLHWRASGKRERLRAVLTAPLLFCGAIAYTIGTHIAARRGGAEAPLCADDAPGIYVLLQVRNGMRYLPGYFENLHGKVAGVIALDDGSTDGSREFLRDGKLVCSLISNPSREPHQWDEIDNRKKLVEAALSVGATWVIAIDVDERLPENFPGRLKFTLKRARTGKITAFSVWLRELWDEPDKYRVDGVWGSKRVARLFNVQSGEQYDDCKLHGQWAPTNSKKSGTFIQADLEIFHLSMIRRRDRIKRRRKYESLDPDRRWQAVGYEYLTDESGCVCRTINQKAMYQPLARETEIDPQPPRILALLAFHNEARFLCGYLNNVAPQVDGIIALDDGSTDGSADIVRLHPKVLELLSNTASSPHEWNENANQRRLLRAAARHHPDWLLVVDADERLEKNFRDRANGIVRFAEYRGVAALSVAFRELWGSWHTYRTDGVWGGKRKANLFKYREDHEFDGRPMHNYWAPLNSRINGQYAHANLELYHLRMIDPEDREIRRQRYLRLDPEQKWQKHGYGYLVDETGIELEMPDSERHYLCCHGSL